MGIELVVGQTNSEVIEIHPTVAAPPGPQGEKGDKGDVGGLAVSTNIVDGTDLNTLTTQGLYFRASDTGTTTALNYPVAGWAGWVEVITSASGVIMQRATSTSSNPAGTTAFEGNTWFRTKYANVWQPWFRVDYKISDTGTRSVPTIAASGFTATTSQWRRMGNTVMASVIIRADAAFTSGGLAFTVPTGFRPAMVVNSSPPYSGIGPMSINVGGTANLWVAMSVNDQRAYSWTWLTADTWPTTLPGTAV